MRTPICDRLDIEFPIFAFSHCRDVVAAVSKAGGFGVLGAVAFTPSQLEVELDWIDDHVGDRPYGVDIIVPAKYVGIEQGGLTRRAVDELIPAEHREFLDQLLDRYGVEPLPAQDARGGGDELMGFSHESGRALLDVIWAHEKVRLVANALGPAPDYLVTEAHDRDVLVAGLVGTVVHAERQRAAGVDLVIAQGAEAGGHTGEIGTMVLVPQVVDAVAPTPVLAAGGIADGRQVAAALALGAARSVVRIGVADDGGGRDASGRQGEVPRRHVRGHVALAGEDRQAGAPAALVVDRRVGGPIQSGPAADAVADDPRRRGRGAHRQDGRRRTTAPSD